MIPRRSKTLITGLKGMGAGMLSLGVWLAAALGQSAAPIGQEQTPARRVVLEVDTQQVHEVPDLVELLAPDAVILAMMLGPGKFVLVGRAPGLASLGLRLADGRTETWEVRVLEVDHAAMARGLCVELADDEDCAGFGFAMTRGRLMITGVVRDLAGYQTLRSVRVMFPKAINLVRVEPEVLDAPIALVNRRLAEAGLGGCRLVRTGFHLSLEGTVAAEDEIQRAQAITEAHLEEFLGEATELIRGP